MRMRFSLSALVCALILVLSGAAVAQAADGGPPPPPRSASGGAVETLAQGVPTPTQFAFGAGVTFVAAAGAEDGSASGGVFVVRDGAATLVPGTPRLAFGALWVRGTLYVTSGPRLLALTGWDGTRFARTATVFTGPRGMPSLTGLALGPNGRIYTGVSFTRNRFDHERSTEPLAQRLISLKRDGSRLRVIASGLRQPWMMAFVPGSGSPFVSVLAQDNLRVAPPDWIVHARRGQDYGFAECTWAKPRDCRGFPRPTWLLPSHASPMGIGFLGGKLYLALFGGIGRSGPEVVSLRPDGTGRVKPALTGFAAPVVALGVHDGWVYTGDLTGAIYRTRP